MKNFFKGKSFGFYFSLFVIVFSVITAVVYGVGYQGDSDYTQNILWALGGGVVAAGVLMVCKRYNWVPVVLALGNFAALLLFIRSIYFYVSVVMYGINGSAFSPAFLSSTAFLALGLVFSVANIFLKQVKED